MNFELPAGKVYRLEGKRGEKLKKHLLGGQGATLEVLQGALPAPNTEHSRHGLNTTGKEAAVKLESGAKTEIISVLELAGSGR